MVIRGAAKVWGGLRKACRFLLVSDLCSAPNGSFHLGGRQTPGVLVCVHKLENFEDRSLGAEA